jgi:hypothetical protein
MIGKAAIDQRVEFLLGHGQPIPLGLTQGRRLTVR